MLNGSGEGATFRCCDAVHRYGRVKVIMRGTMAEARCRRSAIKSGTMATDPRQKPKHEVRHDLEHIVTHNVTVSESAAEVHSGRAATPSTGNRSAAHHVTTNTLITWGIILHPAVSALFMSLSTIGVAINAQHFAVCAYDAAVYPESRRFFRALKACPALGRSLRRTISKPADGDQRRRSATGRGRENPIGQDLAKAETEPALREFVAATWSGGASEAVHTVVKTLIGKPADAILQAATADTIDLIVIGIQGLGGFRKWLLGSTTERLLRRTHVPVLAVPLASESDTVPQRGAFRSHRFWRQPISATLR